MHRLVVCLLIGILVGAAGCLDGPGGSRGATPLEPEAAPWSLAGTVPLPQDAFGAEPILAIAPEGPVYVAAAAFHGNTLLRPGGWLWMSQDQAATWATIYSPSDAPLAAVTSLCACDSDVVAPGEGRVYYVEGAWRTDPPGVRTVNWVFAASLDGGATWSVAPLTTTDAPRGGFDIDRPWLLAGPQGVVAIVYRRTVTDAVTGAAADSLRLVRSADDGASWGDPTDLWVAPPGTVAFARRPWNADGTWVVPVVLLPAGPQGAAQSLVLRSRDHGATWEHSDVPLVTVDGSPRRTAFAPGHGDVLHYVEAVYDGRNTTLWWSSQSAPGRPWPAARSLSVDGMAFQPWIAARDGRVAVVWYHGDGPGDTDGATDTTWRLRVALSSDDGATFTVVDPLGDPLYTGPLPCGGLACGNPLADFLGAAFSADGSLLVSYVADRDPAAAGLDPLVHVARLQRAAESP